ncbi:hypothetical protein CEXT_729111 [Caerostris extrusa]|uniref:Uncharacterized protein n=1 Tax=Caerostris extrusa TaxID=172846 RepID=A0AAV4PFB0_CAEEX|nr:hypothetical protein CEXT_729111 [Caerostris extrusa]
MVHSGRRRPSHEIVPNKQFGKKSSTEGARASRFTGAERSHPRGFVCPFLPSAPFSDQWDEGWRVPATEGWGSGTGHVPYVGRLESPWLIRTGNYRSGSSPSEPVQHPYKEVGTPLTDS